MSKKVAILSVIALVVVLALGLGLKKFFFRPKAAVEEVAAKAEVAIVIDDWGYNLHCLDLLRQIDVPLTVSILPNLRYSSKIARIAKSQGKEIILHLPLEPQIQPGEHIGLEQDTITTEMSKVEVIATIERAFSSVSEIDGVSNHMGSRATENRQLMSIIFKELKKRNLYFLDNLVTNESICKRLASEMELRCVLRDFFLDNLDDTEYIKEQFEELSRFALAGKQAVGIGHARVKTLQVLKDQIPLMQGEGIEFVFVSDLLK